MLRHSSADGYRYTVAVAAAITVALVLPVVGSAHHSVAGRFDTRSLVEVEGEIVDVRWRSPHVEFTLNAVDETGAVVPWHLEAAAPSTLIRSGLQADTIEVGDHVRVAGWMPMTERKETFLQNVLLPGGEELLLWVSAQSRWSEEQANDFAFWRQTQGDTSRPELGIFRVWSSSLALPRPFGLNRSNASEFPLTPVAREAVDRIAGSGQNLAIQGCVPKGMPLIMEQPYPIEFRRDGNNIVLHLEEYDAVRTIEMNVREAPAGIEPSPLGYSTGEWDGNTLVVTTTRLNWPWFSQSGIPQSSEAVLVEEFTPSDDGSLLTYRLTATDPVNFTEPVTIGKQWLYLPDQEVRPYDCEAETPE